MSLFGKKELEAKQAELNVAKNQIQNLSSKIAELTAQMQSEREQLEVARQELEHDKDLFKAHQNEREQALKNQEEQMGQEIDSRRKMLDSQKEMFDEHLQKTTDEYDKRLKELEEKSIALDKAKIDFEPKLREAESNFAQMSAENERKIQERVTQTSKENFARQKEFDEKLHDAHQKSEKEHEDLLLEQANKRIRQTDEELSARRDEIATKEAALRKFEINLEERRKELDRKQRENDTQKSLLEANIENVNAKNAALDAKAAELADAKIRELNARLENYKEQHERLSKERAALETQINSFAEIKKRLGDEEPEIILYRMQALERQIADLKEKLATIPENVEEELAKKDDEISEKLHEIGEYKNRLREAQTTAALSENDRLEIASLKTNNTRLAEDNRLLETLNAEQDAALKHYRELYDKKATHEEKLKSLTDNPYFSEDKISREYISFGDEDSESEADKDESDDFPEEDLCDYGDDDEKENVESDEDEVELAGTESADAKKSVENEIRWLNSIAEKIKKSGLDFSPRIIKAFHTALKTAEWSPLTVLAGVSGTGKSELPGLYAKFGGINFVNISVQPNWDSQEAMLGFYNTIESRFDAQPVLRFLVQTQQNKDENPAGIKEQMNIVLLDEMNLAHIEQYFASFLSKLEERRGKSEEKPNFPNLDVNLGGTHSYPLPMGRNVLWVGTMNQDETTKSLSDKVLDRGIVINFPRPKTFARRLNLAEREETIPENRRLRTKTWLSWVSSFDEAETKDIIAPYKELVEKINDSISKIGRAIGHRVWQSIENYIWNYPDVRECWFSKNPEQDADEFKRDLQKKIDPAFEDQLVQKIMPKLRGIETRGESKICLQEIRNAIDSFKNSGHNLNITQDFENAIKFGDGQFLWVTSEYLNVGDESK